MNQAGSSIREQHNAVNSYNVYNQLQGDCTDQKQLFDQFQTARPSMDAFYENRFQSNEYNGTRPYSATSQQFQQQLFETHKNTNQQKQLQPTQTTSNFMQEPGYNKIDVASRRRLENALKHIETLIDNDISKRNKLTVKAESADFSEISMEKDTVLVKEECRAEPTCDEPVTVDSKKPYLSVFTADSNAIRFSDNVSEAGNVEDAKTLLKNGGTRHRRYKCPHCPCYFVHPKRYLIHTKWHSFGKRMFDEQPNSKRHRTMPVTEINTTFTEIKSDEETKPIPCSECQQEFVSEEALKKHKQKFHAAIEEQCKMCNAMFTCPKLLKYHKECEHNKTDSGYTCKFCQKVFMYRHTLIRHVQSHNDKTHPCPKCDKKFGSPQLLKLHVKIHERMEKDPKFHCSFCSKSFYQSYSLTLHERVHRGERPYGCTICGSSYSSNQGLKRHIKVSHNANKLFECDICHRSFSTDKIMKKHKARQHGTKGPT